ncbi:NnrU family protein [Dongia sp.]|uniref:NnrU family protein n=1 Tax=Dongia sp. TaxID=1977262 RepID=UPI0035B2A45B
MSSFLQPIAAWSEFAAALGVFFCSHAIAASRRLRGLAIGMVGQPVYQAVYSLLSLALLYWLIVAARRAPYVALWDAAGWQYLVPLAAMPIVCVLVACGIKVANPFSLGGHADGFAPAAPGIAGVTRHPLLWALALWSMAHIVPNGDLAHVLLFGLFAVYAALGALMLDVRRRRVMGEAQWGALSAQTSWFPGTALIAGRWRPRWHELPLCRILLGLALYAILLLLHETITGIAIVSMG